MTVTIQHQPWPKLARLNREVIITEKIDGTNAAVGIVRIDPDTGPLGADDGITAIAVLPSGDEYAVYAQSRKRIITPGGATDNYGFAQWVSDNALDLVLTLGEGLHFGEWYGQGIQRGYGLSYRRFALFDVDMQPRISAAMHDGITVPAMHVVPVLYRGMWAPEVVDSSLETLRVAGSYVAPTPGVPPEGVVIYHTAARVGFKVTLENDEVPKSVAERKAAALAEWERELLESETIAESAYLGNDVVATA